jgi:predicted PhzF superfamily epimerase YddE/YHI9
MAAIAREFNQSETTFITTATRADALWRLRSFTPDGSEVTGAGHNSLGAWWGSAIGCTAACQTPHSALTRCAHPQANPVHPRP